MTQSFQQDAIEQGAIKQGAVAVDATTQATSGCMWRPRGHRLPQLRQPRLIRGCCGDFLRKWLTAYGSDPETSPHATRGANACATWRCLSATLLSLSATLLTGCVQNNTFNPLGRDVSLAFSWTLAGETPTEETCREEGIGDVQLIFIEDVPGTPRRFDFNPQACDLGTFDSRTFRTPQVLDAGDKLIQWRALDRRGFVLLLGETTRHTPDAESHLDLGTFPL